MIDVDTFNRQLYEEHLEEASFLYEQRVNGLDDLELTWLDLAAYESRRDAHLAGLICGGPHALAICRDAGLAGDPGELFCAVYVHCRQADIMPLLEVLHEFEPSDPEHIRALVEALVLACPQVWYKDLLYFAKDQVPIYRPVVLRLLAWYRNRLALTLLDEYATSADGLGSAFPWACGRINARHQVSELRRILEAEDKNTDLRETALALLRLGDTELAPFLAKRARKPWTRLALGLCGGPGHCNKLMNATPTSSSTLLGLGLLGDVSGIPPLLGYLRRTEVAPIAARALELITGATLFERVWVPEEPDEDVLSPAELEAWRDGKPVLNPNGNPAGEYVDRISQDINTWLAWWRKNEEAFERGKRYRRGKLITPKLLLDGMADPHTPNMLRDLAHHELLIRYGCDVPFELEMPVAQQQRAIEQIAEWVAHNDDRFKPGAWYSHGYLV